MFLKSFLRLKAASWLVVSKKANFRLLWIGQKWTLLHIFYMHLVFYIFIQHGSDSVFLLGNFVLSGHWAPSPIKIHKIHEILNVKHRKIFSKQLEKIQPHDTAISLRFLKLCVTWKGKKEGKSFAFLYYKMRRFWKDYIRERPAKPLNFS